MLNLLAIDAAFNRYSPPKLPPNLTESRSESELDADWEIEAISAPVRAPIPL
jgi:hypothetical protein